MLTPYSLMNGWEGFITVSFLRFREQFMPNYWYLSAELGDVITVSSSNDWQAFFEVPASNTGRDNGILIVVFRGFLGSFRETQGQ